MKIFSKKNKPDNIIDTKKISKNFFIAAGRLTRQKNFHYLIDEFNEFLKFNQSYNLLIFGKGELEKSLVSSIKKKKLSDKVFLMGHTENLYYYIKYLYFNC